MTEKLDIFRKSYYHATSFLILIFWFVVLFNEEYIFSLAYSLGLWLFGTSLYMGYRSFKVFREDKKILYLFISLASYLLAFFTVYDIIRTSYNLIINNL